MKNFAITSAKIIFAFLALYYVLSVADLAKIGGYIKKSNPALLFLAFALMNLSTIINGLRLGVYMKNYGCATSRKNSIKLFYKGTFFNLVLPGGIGGDGYIALKVKRGHKISAPQAIRMMIATRANGLLFLNATFFCFFWFSDFVHVFKYGAEIITALFILQFPVYFLFAKYFFKEKLRCFLEASMYSFLAQLLVAAAVLAVLYALGVEQKFVDYLSLYSASAVASVIPVTPGGAGIRELVYYQGASLAGLNPEFAVACSLVYFAIYFLTGMVGLIFYLKKSV